MKSDITLLQEAYRSIYSEALSVDEAISKLPLDIQEIANSLQNYLSRGARKASFYYKSKISGREGRYLVNLGVDYSAAKKESYDAIKKYKEMLEESDPQNPDIAVADKILNPAPRKVAPETVDRKVSLGHGITIQDTQKEPGVYRLYIYAYVETDPEKDESGNIVRDFEGKVVRSGKGSVEEVVPATKQKTTSSAEQLQYKLKTKLSRFRRFILDPENISGVTASGGIIEFHKGEPDQTENP
jgi:hypothetical protein